MVAKGFEKLPKVQKIAQSDHTGTVVTNPSKSFNRGKEL